MNRKPSYFPLTSILSRQGRGGNVFFLSVFICVHLWFQSSAVNIWFSGTLVLFLFLHNFVEFFSQGDGMHFINETLLAIDPDDRDSFFKFLE